MLHVRVCICLCEDRHIYIYISCIYIYISLSLSLVSSISDRPGMSRHPDKFRLLRLRVQQSSLTGLLSPWQLPLPRPLGRIVVYTKPQWPGQAENSVTSRFAYVKCYWAEGGALDGFAVRLDGFVQLGLGTCAHNDYSDTATLVGCGLSLQRKPLTRSSLQASQASFIDIPDICSM